MCNKVGVGSGLRWTFKLQFMSCDNQWGNDDLGLGIKLPSS